MIYKNPIKDFDKFLHIKKVSAKYVELKIDLNMREAGVIEITFYEQSSQIIFYINGYEWDVIIENPQDFFHIYDDTEQVLLENGINTRSIRFILEYLQSSKKEIEFIIKFYNDRAKEKVLNQ